MTVNEISPNLLLGVAMLGVVKAHGWMDMPVSVDLNRVLEMLPELPLPRDQAVVFARQMIDLTAEQFDVPTNFSEHDEEVIITLLGEAYDKIAAEL